MDWLHFIVSTPFENFLGIVVLTIIILLYATRGHVQAFRNHQKEMKQEQTKLEIQRGKNLDKQLELERLRHQPKQNIITPEDIEHLYQTGYQELPPQH